MMKIRAEEGERDGEEDSNGKEIRLNREKEMRKKMGMGMKVQ